jgi:hypothetical protein
MVRILTLNKKTQPIAAQDAPSRSEENNSNDTELYNDHFSGIGILTHEFHCLYQKPKTRQYKGLATLLLAVVRFFFLAWYKVREAIASLFYTRSSNFMSPERDYIVSDIVEQHQWNLDSDDTLAHLLRADENGSHEPLPPLTPSCVVSRERRKRTHPRLVRVCADIVHNKWGLPKDIPANRMMIRKFVGDHLMAHGMRPSHIARILPIIVELCFVPSTAMIEAQEIAACSYVLKESRSYNGGIVAVDGTLVRPGEGP